jgi:8-oxo-dGTP diphosphatase
VCTIYFGTNNAAKVDYINGMVKNLPLRVVGTNELPNIDHNIDESGKEPLENAKIKALHYYGQIKQPVFSIDSGLFFENIQYKDQPGTQVRRVNGKKLNDDEMLEYYSKLAAQYGGEIIGYYKNAMCIIINDDTILEKDDGKINTERFILTSKPHQKRVKGWPLDSLSKEIESRKYYYDINRNIERRDIVQEYERIFSEIMDRLCRMNQK